MTELSRLVSSSDAEFVILAALSSVTVVDAEDLLSRTAAAADGVVKFSVQKTPIEMFAARRETAVRLIEASSGRSLAGGSLREELFEGALDPAIDVLEDLPGEFLFQSDLMEYYENNMWLVSHADSTRYHATVARLPALNDRGAESRIGEKGSVGRSWIASGVAVEGAVEESVIFPNVVIGRNARVSRSVILNGNRIGAGAEVQAAIVLPSAMDAQRPALSIGENCSIGNRGSVMKNADYPDQIRGGIAVIGANAEIPSGFRAEGASYVPPGTPAAVLKKLKVLRRGASVRSEASVPSGQSVRDTSRREAQ